LLAFTFTAGISQAQTAEGGCSSVKIVSGIPNYPNNAYIDPIVSHGDQCNKHLHYGYQQYPQTAQFSLQKNNGESWTTVSNWQTSSVFNNITEHGWYRVAVRVPEYLVVSYCSSGWINIYSTTFQWVGFEGVWASTLYSNQVVVGATVPGDINWVFVDTNSNNFFYVDEEIIMNTAGTKNYDRYWVAIMEKGGQSRYWTDGWKHGLIPNNMINLTEKSDDVFGGVFDFIPVRYQVQFAIMSSCDTEWTNLDEEFLVCEEWSTGCRIAGKQEKIGIAPNPAASSFSITNLDEATRNSSRLTLTDMTGKIVKNFPPGASRELDISDLPNGLYILRVMDRNFLIHTAKLSVVK
jgi:hypothetical protein